MEWKHPRIQERRAAIGKDTHLVNIYLKIHHKKVLTMDGLRYLAEPFMNMADDRKVSLFDKKV